MVLAREKAVTTDTIAPGVLDRIAELSHIKSEAGKGISQRATENQRAKGKLTVDERLALLFDEGTFTEVEPLRRHRATGFGLELQRPYTDGVVTGWGLVHGRSVFVYAHDFRIFGGSLGEAHAEKIHKIMDMALAAGAPLVSLSDGAGARIQEGVTSLAGYGGIFRRNVAASGVIPQISVILGPCAGGAAYSPALTDFVFMVDKISYMYITGPDVVKAVTGEDVSHDDLGGAKTHAKSSGVSAFVHDTEAECLQDVRRLLAMLPANSREHPPIVPNDDPIDRPNTSLPTMVPANMRHAYDMRAVIEEIVDDEDFFEVRPHWAKNILCGFARMNGQTVGVVANQPRAMAGVLDIRASEKAANFIEFCDAFNISLMTFVDVPGFLPGKGQELNGIIRHGAKLVYAYCNATVPRVSVILRKAYGGAYIAMDSRSIGCDLAFAWPLNEIAVMGAEGAANIVFRREIAASDDPEATRARLVKEYRTELMHPYYAAERGLVDDVIDPVQTRSILIRSLAMLRAKKVQLPDRKHGTTPL